MMMNPVVLVSVQTPDMDRVDMSGRMVWGSGSTGREGRVNTVVLGQCGW
jgi:hypothetical protein